MANYREIHELKSNADLLDVVETACIIAAEGIVGDESPPTNQIARLKWAEQVFTAPRAMAVRVLPAVLAANKDATVEQIESASDTAFQINVNAVVDLFADLIV